MAGRRKSRTPVRERASQRGVLAAIVAARREELNLRQPELAEIAGCSTRFVHDLEAGKVTVQLNKLLDVLDVLGLRLQIERGSSAQTVTAGSEVAAIYGIDSAAAPSQERP